MGGWDHIVDQVTDAKSVKVVTVIVPRTPDWIGYVDRDEIERQGPTVYELPVALGMVPVALGMGSGGSRIPPKQPARIRH